MKKVFYIFRHGETDFNKEGRRQGQMIDASLNSAGLEQAKEVSRILGELDIDVIISSPLKRARETAEVLSEVVGKQILIEEDLKEGNFGVTEGMLRSDILEKYHAENKIWEELTIESDANYRLEGGESRKEISDRFMKVLNKYIKTQYSYIAVSTHAGMMRYLYWHFGMEKYRINNGEILKLVYEDGNWIFID